jgi:hypothetical protein
MVPWSQLIMGVETIFHNILPMQKLEPGQLSLTVTGVGDGWSGVRPLTGAGDVSRFLVQNSSGAYFNSMGKTVSVCGQSIMA